MRARVSILALAIVTAGVTAACSGGATAPIVNENIAGVWHLTATIADTFSLARTTCTLAGTYTFSQPTGPFFTGAVSGSSRACVGPAPTVGGFDGAITGGQLSGNDLGFRTTALQCIYGSVAESNPTATSVTVFLACSLPRGAGQSNYNGAFTMTK